MIFLLLVGSISLIFSFVPSAYAVYSTTQPNALASYDSDTNEIQVEWDFTTGGADAPETCLLKGDFWYFTDLDNAYHTDQTESDTIGHPYYDHVTRITGFTPIHYSVVSSTPTIVGPDQTTEVIPCQGSTRIDLDTMMSHESNVALDGVTPRLDLQIFLSFYALDANTLITLETFDHQIPTFMDQIFVFYTPTDTWSDAAKNYACGGEIGNVLYLDQSGIHGNNGDNCGDYLSLENNQWVDIGMVGATAIPLKGDPVYGLHTELAPLLQQVIVKSIKETSKNGGGCSGDCTKPTFFKNKMGMEIVKNGFELDGNATDVINYHLPWELITLNTNQTYNMKLKVYETNTLKWIGVYFGVPEIGSPLGNAESEAIFHLNYNKEIEEIVTVDKSALIDIITSNVTMISCGYTESECYLLDFDFVFRDSLKNNVVGIQAVDMARNSVIHYINDGIQAVGESMNVPLISQVSASKGGAFYPQDRGTVELTLISYKDDLWQDKFGYLWTGDGNKSFKIVSIIPVPHKEPDVTWFSMTRMNSNFSDMIQYEKDRAILIFDGSKLLNEIGDSFAYELPQGQEEYNKELAIKLEIEAEKATKLTKDYT